MATDINDIFVTFRVAKEEHQEEIGQLAKDIEKKQEQVNEASAISVQALADWEQAKKDLRDSQDAKRHKELELKFLKSGEEALNKHVEEFKQ